MFVALVWAASKTWTSANFKSPFYYKFKTGLTRKEFVLIIEAKQH